MTIDAEYLQFIDYNYAVICRLCEKKVLDPDKVKNQIYLKGKCPSCGEKSAEKQQEFSVFKSKKQIKKEAKKARQAAKRNENLSIAKHGLQTLVDWIDS